MTEVEILHRVSSIVSSSLTLDEMLGQIAGLTVQVTACDACLVYLLDGESGELVLRASQAPHASELGVLRLKSGEGIPGGVVGHKSVAALPSKAGADAPSRQIPRTDLTCLRQTPDTLVSAPICCGAGLFDSKNQSLLAKPVRRP